IRDERRRSKVGKVIYRENMLCMCLGAWRERGRDPQQSDNGDDDYEKPSGCFHLSLLRSEAGMLKTLHEEIANGATVSKPSPPNQEDADTHENPPLNQKRRAAHREHKGKPQNTCEAKEAHKRDGREQEHSPKQRPQRTQPTELWRLQGHVKRLIA
ncbi:MAG TPA: hypothetical protein VHI52_03475, partial [Verrucomicrobiae bacterium]|nr:hypothetical protein [Verrucomicrobiae bacterium]